MRTKTFWSRTFLVLPQAIELRLYVGELKLTDVPAVSREAIAELMLASGGGVNPDSATLSANRAGMHFALWISPVTTVLERLRSESSGWKECST